MTTFNPTPTHLASDVGSVTIKDWTVSIRNLSWVVKDNDLGSEVLNSSCRLVLGIRGNITSLDILNWDVLDVETNIVSRNSLGQRLVVHFNRLNLSGQLVRSESYNHAWLENTSLNTTDRDCSNTSNFVNILKWIIRVITAELIYYNVSISVELSSVIHSSDPKDEPSRK